MRKRTENISLKQAGIVNILLIIHLRNTSFCNSCSSSSRNKSSTDVTVIEPNNLKSSNVAIRNSYWIEKKLLLRLHKSTRNLYGRVSQRMDQCRDIHSQSCILSHCTFSQIPICMLMVWKSILGNHIEIGVM